jgi:hypothetical protein
MIGNLFSSLLGKRKPPPTAAAPAAATVPPPEADPDAKPASHWHTKQVVATQMLIETMLAQPAYADPKRLERSGWKAYSQNDEDGIIQEIFERIGEPHRTFVEFGCGNGVENNTCYLLSRGWRGLWMDGGDRNASGIRRAYAPLLKQGLLQFEQVFITRENIDALVSAARLGPEIDLLSIDVDGNDYYVWEAIRSTDARVVVIEYNAKFRPPNDWCITYDPAQMWDNTDRMGCSLQALANLGETKGYQLVGCNITGSNAFFVRRDLAGDLFASPSTAAHLFQPPRYYMTGYFPRGHATSSISILEGAWHKAGLPWPPAP